ncbi:MAG: tetratricopeptide repeat protein [Anaerolineae bacterium]|jgi:tetratricopeptide (TPR) repeat protein|nr:tetratricopeptide repeat protein [Anaerolineae bacterium]
METILAEAKQDYEAGRLKQAAEKYRMILDANPDDALAHQGLAQCLNRFARYEEAIEECNRALELDPGLAIPHSFLGSIYFRQHRFEEGEIEFRRAIELDPALEEAYISLGATLSEQERFQEAESVLRRALELNPNRSITHYNLSIAYGRQKRYHAALREALRAFQLEPSMRIGWAIILGVLGYLEEHRLLFLLLRACFLILPFLVPSLLTLPLFALGIGYLTLGIVLDLRSGRRARGVTLLLLVVALVAMYVYHMIYSL